MANLAIQVPGFGEVLGEAPLVILGPNGSGKTRLAQQIATQNPATSIGAQRRTWIDDSLPVQEEAQLRGQVQGQINQWRQRAWYPTEEINHLLSSIIQEHTEKLTKRNDESIRQGVPLDPITDTKLMQLQQLWGKVYPFRRLEIGGFFPKVRRVDGLGPDAPYSLRDMSDGERTILYMAARVLTCDQPVLVVDEPELHLHSRLSIKFWTEAESLRRDCRFVYVTHDLNFAMSRISATVLAVGARNAAQVVDVSALPADVVQEVLGAATLPFYASRIVFFEGERNAGFAEEFFQAWFSGNETFALPVGGMDAVLAAVSGLQSTGMAGGEVIGLVDRDYYSDEALRSLPANTFVLSVHEVESLLCLPAVVRVIASYLGKDPDVVLNAFHDRVRAEFRGQTLSGVVARRVRARIGDLLQGVFAPDQIDGDVHTTATKHEEAMAAHDFPARTRAQFLEEHRRVTSAIANCDEAMLAVLPGKHLISLLGSTLGFGKVDGGLPGLIVRALLAPIRPDDAMSMLGVAVGNALVGYLPPRRHE
ncbi:MAG: AAA family ATPase [Hydrogenophaga sp.]|nr:AAA family ATPase [Hydrogenophaga sp.]